MSFEDPTNVEGGSPLEPGRYLVKLVKLEEAEPGQYGPSLRWYFNVATLDSGTPATVFDQNGDLYEFWQYSSPKLTPSSRARPWVEALLGRKLIDDQERGPDIAAVLIGCKALALIGPQKAKNSEKVYTAILSMSPYTETAKATKAVVAQKVAVAATAASEEVAF